MPQSRRAFLSLVGLLGLLWPELALAQAGTDRPIVGAPVLPRLSRPVSELPVSEPYRGFVRDINPRHNPLEHEPDAGRRATWDRAVRSTDPLVTDALGRAGDSPPSTSFAGTTNLNGVAPPDTIGDVGPNHYVHMVNLHFLVLDKNGSVLAGPANTNSLFSGAGGNCETTNDGDPIVLYDVLADRWLLSQFAFPSHLCVAISQTADPTGAYYLYEFNVGAFPDYFKLGVWPDAYYMSANETTYTAYAFDRVSMLAGSAATFQKFTGQTNLLLPADLDGTDPPAAGEPGLFYTFKDNSFHGGNDRIELFALDVDWVTPANTTFTLAATVNIASFTYTPCGFFNFNCLMQLGTTQRLDTIAEWPMFRFAYRNLGTHESLVGTFTVGGGLGEVGAALRWFELRDAGAGWTLHQEGTFDPGDGHDRAVGSIAMDRWGNIAVGYTVSSSTINPRIRYAARSASDALGTLRPEGVLIDGSGSQTGSNRWGDYASMSIDPADDATFWFTSEYYASSSGAGWQTRIGKLSFMIFTDGFESGTTTAWSASVP